MHNFGKRTAKVSIVIPSWFADGQNGKYGENETFWFAEKCLERLIRVTPKNENNYELIIIDNGSTLGHEDDATKNIELYNRVTNYFGKADIVISNNKNLGFGPACNQGFAVSRGKYIVCMNNDILVWPGWLDAMIEGLENERLIPRAGVIMPALTKETRDARGALLMESVDLNSNFNEYGIRAEFGSLWIAKRELLMKIAERRGGYYVFDEDFLCGMGEDRLLWQEVRKLGFETFRTHKTRVFHQGNLTIGKIPNRKDYTIPNREKLEKKKNELWETKN